LEKHVLIVAGGKGSRMGTDIPKQFHLLAGKPILFHTFDAFLHITDVNFVLVLGSDFIDHWKKLCVSYNFDHPHKIAVGGHTRFQSVKNGLELIPDESIVLIHDAVRPFASSDTINNAVDKTKICGNAIPVIDIVDSIRYVGEDFNQSIDRNKLKVVQTPQVFQTSIIKKAYNQTYKESYTDDASVLESSGVKICLSPGNRENIKISNKIDLEIAEGMLKHLSARFSEYR
jgi:2-C-methyl-D-erythritol 4-phosphate cytidylyltransferase